MAVSRRQLIGDKVSGLCSGVSIVTGTGDRVPGRQRRGAREGTGTGTGRGVFSSLSHCLHGRGRVFFLSLSHCLYGRGREFFPLCHIVCTGLGAGLRRYSKVPREPWRCTTRGQSDSFRPGHPGAYIGRRGPCQGPPSRRKQLKLGRSLWGLSLR